MKILITGARGQLARDIVKMGIQKGHEVIPLGHKQLDIVDFTKVQEAISAFNPNVVINCAAYNAVDKAESDWHTALMINGIGPGNLALICHRHRIPLVHFSTDFVFDGRKKCPYTIADIPSPLNKYGQSKLLGEQEVRHLTPYHYLIRVSWVFGAEGKTEVNFAKKVISWAQKGEKLRIVADQISSPSYTPDVAQAVLELIQTGRFGLYHIANSGYCSRYEWAKFILKKMGWTGELCPAKSDEFQAIAKRPPFSALDTFPLKEVIKYQLPDWQEATERFLKEFLKI